MKRTDLYRACIALGAATPLVSSTRPARAVVLWDDYTQAQSIVLGATYPSVCRLGRTGSTDFNAGGVLITPNTILTAAHIEATGGGAPTTAFFGGVAYTVASFTKDPLDTGITGGYDVAIIKLTTPVVGIAPSPIYTGTVADGTAFTGAGFGDSGTGTTAANIAAKDPITGLYTKRGYTNILDLHGDEVPPNADGTPFASARDMIFDFDNPLNAADNSTGTATANAEEGLTFAGDSGSPIFITVGGVQRVTGVVSFAGSSDGLANGDYGDIAGVTLLTNNAFVTAALPEPASLGLLAMAPALLRRRRPPAA